MAEKSGNYVAVFRSTVMITKGKTTALTGLGVDESQFKTENSIKDEQILGLLSVRFCIIFSNLWKKRNKRRRESSNHQKLKTEWICKKYFI